MECKAGEDYCVYVTYTDGKLTVLENSKINLIFFNNPFFVGTNEYIHRAGCAPESQLLGYSPFQYICTILFVKRQNDFLLIMRGDRKLKNIYFQSNSGS